MIEPLPLEKLMEMWETDSEIDLTNMGEEVRKTARLHHRYLNQMYIYKEHLKFLEDEMSKLKLRKVKWIGREVSEELWKEFGNPPTLPVPKTDYELYIRADEKIIKLKNKIVNYQNAIDYLTDICKFVSQRNFLLKEYNTSRSLDEGK